VAAALGQVSSAGFERRRDVEVGRRPHGAAELVLGGADDRDRPRQLVRQPAGDEADEPGLPRVVAEDERPGPGGERCPGGGPPRLGERGRGELPSANVNRLERIRQPVRLVRIVRHEQRHGQLGLGDAARRVDPRCDRIRQVSSRWRRRIRHGARHQRPQAGPGRGGQLTNPEQDDRPRLPRHRREVGHGPDCRDAGKVRGPASGAAQERRGQPVGEARSGEVLIGIAAVSAMGIDDRHRRRQHGSRQVMVGDHHVDPHPLRLGDLGDVRHAAVAGDDEPNVALGEARQPRHREAVPVRPARGHVAERVGAERPQGERPDRHCAHAVRVVVTPDGHALPRCHGALDPAQRAFGIRHQVDGMEGLLTGRQEALEPRRARDAAPGEERCDRGAEPRQHRGVDRFGQEPFQSRRDHVGHGSRAGLCRGARFGYRLSGRTCRRPVGWFRLLRFASHSYHATRIWLALKMDE
jgi:hypothetical protein